MTLNLSSCDCALDSVSINDLELESNGDDALFDGVHKNRYNQLLLLKEIVIKCRFIGGLQSYFIGLMSVFWPSIFTASKRSLGQGNIFRSVCQEFCPQGGGEYLGRYSSPDQVYPPGPGTSPWTMYSPQDQVHPQTRYTPWDQVHPLDQVHPQQVHPPGRHTPPGPGTPPRPDTPPWAGIPPPLTRYTPPDQVPPRGMHAGRYGQQAGSTDPTGMHSCFGNI